MKDRVPLHPGRVLITPENGAAAFYATMTRADDPTQEGAPLNKSTLLTDATAALFGLGADAVPNDAFSLLSRFQSNLANEYLWSKGASIPLIGAQTTQLITVDGPTYQYANSVAIVDGAVSLVNPTTLNAYIYDEKIDELSALLAGKYCTFGQGDNAVYYFYSGVSANGGYAMTATIAPVGIQTDYDYKNSADPNKYLADGYTLLGRLGNKVQIATGSYTGTGAYGSSNPTSLTFEFEPKLLLISRSGSYFGTSLADVILSNPRPTFSLDLGGSKYFTNNISWGHTVAWYNSTAADGQLNASGNVYWFAAIG